MKLGELTSVFNNDTMLVIKLLDNGITTQLYSGKIYKYGKYLEEHWPNDNFKDFNIIDVNIINNSLDVLIEK